MFSVFVRENIRSFKHSAGILLALAIIAAFVVTYSLAYPSSYLSFKQRSAQAPPWSAAVDFTSRNRDAVDELSEELSEAFGGAVVVDSCTSEGFVSTDVKVLRDASDAMVEFVPVCLLNRPQKDLYPIDVYIPEGFVLAGNPYSGDGVLIDAYTAQKIGIVAGDILFIGLQFPDRDGQSVTIPESSSVGSGETVENIVFLKLTVNAIVEPSSYFEGVALFQPAGNIRALEQGGEASCTQLLVFGVSKVLEEQARCKGREDEAGVYLESATEETQWAQDAYAQDLGVCKLSLSPW